GWGWGKRPVIFVYWEDAKSYAAWLSRKIGKTYRLLSEAERECVTRAGTTTPFWWGSSITSKQANYDGDHTYAGGGSKGEYRQRTMPVDSFEPNSWGLFGIEELGRLSRLRVPPSVFRGSTLSIARSPWMWIGTGNCRRQLVTKLVAVPHWWRRFS